MSFLTNRLSNRSNKTPTDVVTKTRMSASNPAFTRTASIMSADSTAAADIDDFRTRKRELKRRDMASSNRLYDQFEGHPMEATEKKFATIVNAAKIDTGANFISAKQSYTDSQLFKLLHKMPKGGILHTHGISTGNLRMMMKRVVEDDKIYMYRGEDDKEADLFQYELKHFLSQPKDPLWENCAAQYAKDGEKYVDLMHHFVTLQPEISRHCCWDELNKFWTRTRHLAQCVSFYLGADKYLWDMLEEQLENGVTYIELKEVISFPYYDAETLETVPLEEVVRRFGMIVERFKKQHPRFIGAKIVWVTIKIGTPSIVQKDLQAAMRLKHAFPEYIAGFDMAGHEDSMHPIGYHAEPLLEAVHKARQSDLEFPLMIHAGETHDPENTQLYDALLVGCKRIGHGYSIPKHPVLMNMVREQQVVVECCPLSNKCLGYLRDLSNHPAWVMLNHGLIVTISPDDPGMFNYSDVSYDWTAVVKAWGLNLKQVHKMLKDSLLHSTLRGYPLTRALQVFEEDWSAWVKNLQDVQVEE